jgi:nitroreductase
MKKPAHTDYPIMAELAERWSPRAYDPGHELTSEELGSLFEAARWSPSSSNTQPWSFVVGRRGDETFEMILGLLASGNAVWAHRASALVVNIVEEVTEEGKPLSASHYDVGQAAAHLSIQATHMGLVVHQMGGFDKDGMHRALGLDDRHRPIVAMAIGVTGDMSDLPENIQVREVATRQRKPLGEVVTGL